MIDDLPPQTGFILLLVALALAPASYVFQHMLEGASARDVTGPPPDLSWRSGKKLLLSLLLLAALIAVGVFSFTPLAAKLVAWDGFVPVLLGTFGGFALSTVVKGWHERRVEPLIKGLTLSLDRATQPIRYWLAMTWNALFAALMFVGSVELYRDSVTPRCDNLTDAAELIKNLETCNTMLAATDVDTRERAELLAARGRVHHELNQDAKALADYSAALKLVADDSYTLYNRAVIHARMGDHSRAILDFDASLKLRPDNQDAYLERGLAKLDSRDLRGAIADFTIGHQRDPDDPYPLANRGLAYAWMSDPKRAEADFARVRSDSPVWIVVLRGRAVLAKQRKDHRQVIVHASQALKVEPNDRFSLLMRADAYWAIGQADLSMADDARLQALDRALAPDLTGQTK